jgi:hypothetical protein
VIAETRPPLPQPLRGNLHAQQLKRRLISDLGTLPRLEPSAVAQCDLPQRLAFRHALQGLARLARRHLRLPAEPCARTARYPSNLHGGDLVMHAHQ